MSLNKITFDKWLSTIIRKPTYSLRKFNSRLKKKDLPKGRTFIWSKIPVNNLKPVAYKIRLLYCRYEYSVVFV